jgi:uncharacterized protein YwgA
MVREWGANLDRRLRPIACAEVAGMTSQEPGALTRQAIPIAKALNAVASKTGRAFTMRTQPGRFRIQKTVYLLKHLGYAPAQRFAFNLYHMGPYSPDLATAYYHLEDGVMRAAGEATDIPQPILEFVRAASAKSDAFLEGLTTLLDVRGPHGTLAQALMQAKTVKPHLDEATWREVREFLTAHRATLTTRT